MLSPAVQPIRVQTSGSMVDTAVMHVMEGTACTSELRISAMHEVNPLHMFMFNSRGRTLNMNQAAMEACRYSGKTHISHRMPMASVDSAASCSGTMHSGWSSVASSPLWQSGYHGASFVLIGAQNAQHSGCMWPKCGA